MEKISLYEILSYLVPGYFLLFFADYYWYFVLNHDTHFLVQDALEKSIFHLLIAMFLGVIFHTFTFSMIKNRYVKKYIYPSIDSYVDEDEDLQKIRTYIKNHMTEKSVDINDYFDMAYYHLEVDDKSGVAKNFQSIYFWLRNIFCIFLILIPLQVFLLGFSFLNYYSVDITNSILLISFSIIVLLVLIKPVKFFRGKMIDRVLWSYYNILKSK